MSHLQAPHRSRYETDDLSAAEGILAALPLSLVLWAILIRLAGL